jgi:thiol:disulfide interchange protein DsbD
VAAAVFVVLGIVVAWPGATPVGDTGGTTSQAKAGELSWQPWSPEKLAELRAASTPVFVDFTAAWCVTCQVNKNLVLSRGDVLDAFRARGVQLVRADWTRRDPEIAQALARIGRSGVPAYVLYKPGRAPLVLPEILTRERVIEALDS